MIPNGTKLVSKLTKEMAIVVAYDFTCGRVIYTIQKNHGKVERLMSDTLFSGWDVCR